MFKRAVRKGDKVIRLVKPKGPGPVYEGCYKLLEDGKPLSRIGHNTWAGKFIVGSKWVWFCGGLAAAHNGICTKGKTLTSSKRIFLI